MTTHLYILNTDTIPTDDGRILALLSPERRERILRLIPEKSKRESIGAELLLIYALREKYTPPLPLLISDKGKPYIDGAEHFSLSHSDGVCICAVGECEIGADIEKKRELSESMKARILSDGDSLESAVHVWSAKEAFLKLTGDGIDGTIALTSIETHVDKVTGEGRAACLYQTMYDDFVISVCTFSETDIQMHVVNADDIIKS